MHTISSVFGPVGYGEEPRKAGNPAKAAQSHNQKLISQANAVPMLHVMQHYGLHVQPYKSKLTCPFKDHKGGRENSPSFWYYPDTNSFHCFGCDKGNRAVDFVMEMDGCSADTAAIKILDLFSSKVDHELLVDSHSSSERLELMVKFSSAVFEFRLNHDQDHALDFIEYVCWTFDEANRRHNLDNEALARLVEHCIEYINIYRPTLVLTMEERYRKLIACNK
jgi:hypothetical protein